MKRILIAMAVGAGLALSGTAIATKLKEASLQTVNSDHMVAQATLTAYFIDAAIRAGMSTEMIDSALAEIADQTKISEFWISDENGRIEFTNIGGTTFQFPTDPEGDSQAAPFAALLQGSEEVVVQNLQEREYDGELFKYVGVAGVDKTRIVQVGMSALELQFSQEGIQLMIGTQ